MSHENSESDKDQKDVSKPSIDFDVFETFYKTNPDLDNAEYYQTFPSVNTGTIRSWKARAKKGIETESPQTPQTPEDQTETDPQVKHLKAELIQVLKEKTRFDDTLLHGLDEDSQLKILKNASEQTPDDPNMRLFTPSGANQAKLGIEKFLVMDEKSFKEKGFGDVEINIPASVLFDPKKLEELTKYKN